MFLKFSSAFNLIFWGHKALQASALPTELKSQPLLIIQYKLFLCKSFLNYFRKIKIFRIDFLSKKCYYIGIPKKEVLLFVINNK